MSNDNTKVKAEAETKVNTKQAQIIRKITPKDVLGEIIVPTKKVDLFNIMGEIYGYEIGTSTYGEFIKFRGDFLAVLTDGTEFRAPACIIPSPMDSVLAVMFDKAVSESVDENGVQTSKKVKCDMAVTIGYKPTDSVVGYEWVLTPIFAIESSNAIEAIRQRVQLALPSS